jgi:C4-type Zn-finger protein
MTKEIVIEIVKENKTKININQEIIKTKIEIGKGLKREKEIEIKIETVTENTIHVPNIEVDLALELIGQGTIEEIEEVLVHVLNLKRENIVAEKNWKKKKKGKRCWSKRLSTKQVKIKF